MVSFLICLLSVMHDRKSRLLLMITQLLVSDGLISLNFVECTFGDLLFAGDDDFCCVIKPQGNFNTLQRKRNKIVMDGCDRTEHASNTKWMVLRVEASLSLLAVHNLFTAVQLGISYCSRVAKVQQQSRCLDQDSCQYAQLKLHTCTWDDQVRIMWGRAWINYYTRARGHYPLLLLKHRISFRKKYSILKAYMLTIYTTYSRSMATRPPREERELFSSNIILFAHLYSKTTGAFFHFLSSADGTRTSTGLPDLSRLVMLLRGGVFLQVNAASSPTDESTLFTLFDLLRDSGVSTSSSSSKNSLL